MKRETVLQIIIALIVSIVGAAGMTSMQMQAIDTREERNHAAQEREIDQIKTEFERAIERVQADAQVRIDRVERDWSKTLEKLDDNVQWLIRRQVEHDATEHRRR